MSLVPNNVINLCANICMLRVADPACENDLVAKMRVWIWISIFALTCGALAHGIHWERGPFHDDYFLYSWSTKPLSDWMDWVLIEVRPVSKLLMILIFQSSELIMRVLVIFAIAVTAAFAGLLVYRTTRQKLPAIVVSLICLAPFTGAEAVTWTSAIAHFVPAGLFAVLSLNLFLSALRANSSTSRGILGAISVLLLTLAFGAIEPALNFYILFVGLVFYEHFEDRQQFNANLMLLLTASLGLLMLILLIYMSFYVGAEQVTRRGTIEIPSVNRVVSFLQGYHNRAFGSTFGRDIQFISFREGVTTILTNSTAALLALGAISSAVLAIIDWPRPDYRPIINESYFTRWRIVILISASLLTTVAAMLFPSVLMSDEHGSRRLAYLPGISFALFLGFVIAAIRQRWCSQKLTKIILAISLTLVLILTLRTLGYTRMYQLRQELDQQQILALKAAVPPSLIANHSVTFMPISVSEEFVDYRVNSNPRHIMIGGFTSPNSVGAILKSIYTDAVVDVVRPRYGNLRWRIEPSKNEETLSILGYQPDGSRMVSREELIIFRYRKDGLIDIVDNISYKSQSGDTDLSISFPWSTLLNNAVGTPTFSLEISLNNPEFEAVRE